MRALALAVAMTVALPLPVLAGSSTVQTMNWQQDGARLALRSTEGQVQVDAASPEARFGVRRGDRILRVDDTPVRQIDQLATALRKAPGRPCWYRRRHRPHRRRHRRRADLPRPLRGHRFGYA